MHNGKVRLLTDIRYVLDLKINLISLGTLDELGFCYEVKNGCLNVFKDKNMILSGTKKVVYNVRNGYFYNTARTNTTFIVENDKIALWHLRLGHMNQKSLQMLCKQGFLGKVTVSPLDFCETCFLGKQYKLSFPTRTHLTKVCLKCIHADLWGPTQVQTHRGNKYFLSLVDDFSRKVCLGFLT